jgi:ketosteroid isomerase-like protein
MFACWGEGDLEGMLACADPDLEWLAAADGRLYRGHGGVREFFIRWREGGQRLEVPLQRATEVAEGRVLAVGRLRLTRPGRGLADSPGVWIFDVGCGRVTRIQSYQSERAAMQALDAADAVSTGA